MPPPTADRLKVRCYRCNQLLAVAPNKAGSVVACPRCKAELLIPHPEPQPDTEERSESSVISLGSGTFDSLAPVPNPSEPPPRAEGPSPPSFLDEISALIPPELASLRPEDLRVEADVFGAIVRQPIPTPAPPSPVADAFLLPGSLSGSGWSPSPSTVEPTVTESPSSPGETTPTSSPTLPVAVDLPPPLPGSRTAPVSEASVVIPSIRVEPDPIRGDSTVEPRAIREVVLPASVVLAWSLFVLSAIPMSFLAGLLIGHFLWKAGP